MRSRKRTPILSGSPVLSTILHFVYRKESQNFDDNIVDALVEIGYLKKVKAKDTSIVYYFKTKASEEFKAIDFAKEYLWNFWNPTERAVIDDKRHIFCFHSTLPNGRGLVEIGEAIKVGMV